ncbi:MAG TPA: extracellular solute-binding protein [Candidatus Acidoferrales bacterium]|nr:extracellular solute-binding protein [Candidatus Acidoferrales bacterium]
MSSNVDFGDVSVRQKFASWVPGQGRHAGLPLPMFNGKGGMRKLQFRSKILLGLIGLAYFTLLGARVLYAAEAKPSPPAEWEKTVAAAKKEGKVVVSVPVSAELRKGLETIFKQRFGIEPELNVSRAASVVGKMQQESKSGVTYFDVHMGGGESMISGLLSEGILAPLEPAMILKEVKDPNNWWSGHVWLDNAKRYIYASQAYQVELIWCNTDLVKPDEVRSLNDLLNPKWSGKIGYLDPRTAGAGSSMWSFLWKLKGEEYLRKLAAQKLFLSRDQRVLAESLARGKIALVVGLSYYSFLPFTKAGLPVKSVSTPRDEIYVSGGSGNLAIIKAAPHPNAAKVFINWFLGHEGQETYSRAMGQATRRLDVDTQWTKEFGVFAAKDSLTPEQYTKLENQSEEKVLKAREPAAELARKLLD